MGEQLNDLLEKLLVEFAELSNARRPLTDDVVRQMLTAHSMDAYSNEQRSELLLETLARPHVWSLDRFLESLRRLLLADGLHPAPEIITRLLTEPAATTPAHWSKTLRVVEHGNPALWQHPAVANALRIVREEFDRQAGDSEWHALSYRISRILADRHFPMLAVDDVWAAAAVAELSSGSVEERLRWHTLLEHFENLTGAKPSARWMKRSWALACVISVDQFRDCALRWFSLVDRPRTSGTEHDAQLLAERNCELLKGLVWTCANIPDDEAVRAVAQLAVSTGRKIRGRGPRSIKVMNACIHTLGHIATDEALGRLGVLKSKLKLASAQKEIAKAWCTVATRLNVSREDLEELAVPTYGLTNVGRLEEPLGDFTAGLTVADSGKGVLTWSRSDGKVQKSIPAAVKAKYSEELKDLKATAKDIEKMLTAQRERLDDLFLQERRWPADVWRERYLDHPLVGVLARRLIWQFKNTGLETSGIWLDDTIVNVDDEPIDWIDAEGTTVELWHPLGRPLDDVFTWRNWLERHEVRQPFKQAHREVYVLTDAERRTRAYSNRYAAHILRQHQFHALCAARGWKNQLRLMVDATCAPPTKSLENWGLRVEFWVDTVGDDSATDTTDSGVYRYLSTDQVRFYQLEADRHVAHATGGRYFTDGLQTPINEPLPLEVIPPIVLSEVMRDVDLFVAVASVGNDPTWADGGPGGRYREYWQSFSFGELTPSAQTRKQVLEQLVPRLKIGPRCSFSEKFLIVRGDLRTYKIHLGSGNILMEPNDQYLCIVPDSSAVTKGDSVFLPFEGDRTLSIILSKAMLLADDAKIKDPTISRQIAGS